MRETSVVVLSDEDDVCSGLHAEEGRRSSQTTTNFEACFKATGASLKEAVVDPEDKKTRTCPKPET